MLNDQPLLPARTTSVRECVASCRERRPHSPPVTTGKHPGDYRQDDAPPYECRKVPPSAYCISSTSARSAKTILLNWSKTSGTWLRTPDENAIMAMTLDVATTPRKVRRDFKLNGSDRDSRASRAQQIGVRHGDQKAVNAVEFVTAVWTRHIHVVASDDSAIDHQAPRSRRIILTPPRRSKALRKEEVPAEVQQQVVPNLHAPVVALQ